LFRGSLQSRAELEAIQSQAKNNTTSNENNNLLNATMNAFSRPLRSGNGLIKYFFPCRRFSGSEKIARHLSPSDQKWSHPPSSTTIADDEVAFLANQPLHTLSLADLVKYGILLF
jgi:hypothetical protein